MLTISTSTSWFGARTVVAGLMLMAVVALASAQAIDENGCRVECYPNTRVINGKGGVSASGKKENCRWILRTDGKPARLCDHIQCKKVCPNNQAASASSEQQEAASSSENPHIEQQLEADAPLANQHTESMGIMRQMHGNKLAKAPVPGVAGGRLSNSNSAPASVGSQQQSGARRMAPTLAPAVEYDDKDTPPPIARFLDISPEE